MFVETVLSFVINKLGDYAVEEVHGFLATKGDILWLQRELSMMQAFLRDAKRKIIKEEVVQEWVRQVRRVAFKIEDLIDDHEYRKNPVPESSVTRLLNKKKYETLQGIKSIKDDIQHILSQAQTYGLRLIQDGEAEPARYGTSNLLLCGHDIVGLDEDTKEIVRWLSEDDGTKLSCMAIIGMGGLGKTTLARRAYENSYNIHFDRRIWIDASECFDDNQLISAISKEFVHTRSIMSKRKKSRPSGSTYLLVLDNIRTQSFLPSIWGNLPDAAKAKVIITSRQNFSPPTHSSVIDVHVHLLKPLKEQFGWELFCKKAFPAQSCPVYLEEETTQMVKRCSGLPLAIVLLGGLMHKIGADQPAKWKDVLDHFSAHLTHRRELAMINRVFEESYNHLPSEHQECFVYACLFPKGNEIKRKNIIRLWVAQGFVMKQSSRSLEEIANDYFEELIERCMIEPIYSDFTGELTSFRVHEIISELALDKSKEVFGIRASEGFDQIWEERYISVHKDSEPFDQYAHKNYKARGLLFFRTVSYRFSISNFVYLRVLVLDGSYPTSKSILHMINIPRDIGILYHLKYLGLQNFPSQSLPTSLQNLYNLETLDVRGTHIEGIPFDISKFQSLKHLLIERMKIHSKKMLPMLHLGTNNLQHLQTLSGIKANISFIEKLHQMTQIKKLYIQVTPREVKPLFKCFHCIGKLQSLKLDCLDENKDYAEILADSLPTIFPKSFEKLMLAGIISVFPPCLYGLYSLKELHLIYSMLESDPVHELSKLPNLVSLSLFRAYTGKKISCTSNGFPMLRHLRITYLLELEEWLPIEEGVMPHIQFLSIVDCPNFRMLPQGFEKLIKLQRLELIGVDGLFLMNLEYVDSSKVEHIPIKTFIPMETDMDFLFEEQTSHFF